MVVIGFQTDAKLTQNSESLDCAALSFNKFCIFTLKLSVVSDIMHTLSTKRRKASLVSTTVSISDLANKGAHSRESRDIMRTGTSSSRGWDSYFGSCNTRSLHLSGSLRRRGGRFSTQAPTFTMTKVQNYSNPQPFKDCSKRFVVRGNREAGSF